MRPSRLLALALALVVGWSGWWAWQAWQAHRDTVAWLEARRAAGWQADWGEVRVRGFPNRVDRTITDLALADPRTGWAWEAPFLQILGLSYGRNHLIVVWPPEQSLATPRQKIAVTGERLRASLRFRPGPARDLAEATAVLSGLALGSDAGWRVETEETRLALRPTAGRAGAWDLGLEALGLRPPARLARVLAEEGLAPERLETLSADLSVTLDRPLDRRALEERRPQPVAVEIRRIRAVWGRLDLQVAGDLVADSAGLAEGEIVVKARNWREILALAVSAGLVPERLAGPLEGALEVVSGLAGRPETLDVPVRFRGGRALVGPVPVGPAPALRLP
jgi:hypothetical protein